MYCARCGKEVSETSKFCKQCGHPIVKNDTLVYKNEKQTSIDAVKDIQRKLIEIDRRKRQPPKQNKDKKIKSSNHILKDLFPKETERIKSALDSIKVTVQKENADLGFAFFNDKFEEEKIADKKHLIRNYPLPAFPKELANLAKYIYSQIKSKEKEPDSLTLEWKEKLHQIYFFAKDEISATEEFEEIRKYYKADKRRERHVALREYIPWLFFPIGIAIIVSISLHLPLLLFISILATVWEVFLILYVYDLLEKMIDSLKQKGMKHDNIPRILRVVAWHLLVPLIALLIISIIYQIAGLIILCSILLIEDVLFLVYVYGLSEETIDSLKKNVMKHDNIPRILRVIAWHLLVPLIALLIISIIYQIAGLIYLCIILLIADALFLVYVYCDE